MKNRSAKALFQGYRDFLLNLAVTLPDGTVHVCELQVHLDAFFKIKNGEGHKLYELVRTLGLTQGQQSGKKLLADLRERRKGRRAKIGRAHV